MRHFLQPQVLKWAVIAALASALACYPRLSLWLNRPAPIWYLEATIFFCSIVLWGFVFAWHTRYTNRPVFILKLEPKPFIVVTMIGIVIATMFRLWLDPLLRSKTPEDYPTDLNHWFALLLFALAFNQLFLLFAPFAWLMRLSKNRWVAASLTALFGAGVLAMKIQSLSTPFPLPLLTALLAGRAVISFLAIWFYLRGGVILIWWWTLLFEARLLLDLKANS
jgi:hypothetical protein